MYNLATCINASNFIETSHAGISCGGMEVTTMIELAKKLGWTPDNGVTPTAPVAPVAPSTPKPTEAPQGYRISFGRDGTSCISFLESDLRGDVDAISLAKCMKILMVKHKKTAVQSAQILMPNHSSNWAVLASWKRGWGNLFYYLTTSHNWRKSHFEQNLKNFKLSEVSSNVFDLAQFEKLIADTML